MDHPNPYTARNRCPIGVLIDDSRRQHKHRKHFDRHYEPRPLSNKELHHYGAFPVGTCPSEVLMCERHHFPDRATNRETSEKQPHHATHTITPGKHPHQHTENKEQDQPRCGRRLFGSCGSGTGSSVAVESDPLRWYAHVPSSSSDPVSKQAQVKSVAELGAALQTIVRSTLARGGGGGGATARVGNVGDSGPQYDISDICHHMRRIDPQQLHAESIRGKRSRELPIEYTKGFFYTQQQHGRSWSTTDLRAVRLQAQLQRARMENTTRKEYNQQKNKSYKERQKEQEREQEINLVVTLPEVVSVADDLTSQAVAAPVVDSRAARAAKTRETRRAKQNDALEAQVQTLRGGGGGEASNSRSRASTSTASRAGLRCSPTPDPYGGSHSQPRPLPLPRSLSPTMARAHSRLSTGAHTSLLSAPS